MEIPGEKLVKTRSLCIRIEAEAILPRVRESCLHGARRSHSHERVRARACGPTCPRTGHVSPVAAGETREVRDTGVTASTRLLVAVLASIHVSPRRGDGWIGNFVETSSI